MQQDFSENFCIEQQDEIMSAHWMTESVTLFTALIYQSGCSMSYVVISDELHHDKFAVFFASTRPFCTTKLLFMVKQSNIYICSQMELPVSSKTATPCQRIYSIRKHSKLSH